MLQNAPMYPYIPAKDVRRETAVAGARFDEIETGTWYLSL